MAGLQRAHDWPERFAKFIDARRYTPFAWGSNDCALFAADCCLELTGVDFAEGLRTYDTEDGARELIGRAGGLRAFAARLTEKPIGLAQRGDIVLTVIDGSETYGIAVGDGRYTAPGATGLVFRPMNDAVAVFEV